MFASLNFCLGCDTLIHNNLEVYILNFKFMVGAVFQGKWTGRMTVVLLLGTTTTTSTGFCRSSGSMCADLGQSGPQANVKQMLNSPSKSIKFNIVLRCQSTDKIPFHHNGFNI